MNALQTAATGLNFQQKNLDVVADNIAKVEVPAHKENRLFGSSLNYTQYKQSGTISSTSGNIIPAGVQIGQGVQVAGMTSILKQGSAIQTGNPFHMLIQGEGYFQIQLPDGTTAYTRDGTFTINGDGVIVNHEGFPLIPNITIPPRSQITINASGDVFAKISGQIDPQNIGTIQLATFSNPNGLEHKDGNLSLETPASGNPAISQPGLDGFGRILQGHYEGSNVDVVMAITKLIEIQKAFEYNTKSMNTAAKMLETLPTAI
jgi:flagellar basal-body rod protein FlgG